MSYYTCKVCKRENPPRLVARTGICYACSVWGEHNPELYQKALESGEGRLVSASNSHTVSQASYDRPWRGTLRMGKRLTAAQKAFATLRADYGETVHINQKWIR